MRAVSYSDCFTFTDIPSFCYEIRAYSV